MQRIIFTFSLLSIFTFQLFAQPSESDMKKMKAQGKMIGTTMTMFVKTLSEGKTTGMLFLEDGDSQDFQSLTGTNNEQFAEFYDFMMSFKSEVKPQLEPLIFKLADEDDPTKLAEILTEIETFYDGIFEQVSKKLCEVITPEQFMKMRQLELQTTGPMADAGFPLINFEAYTALDLTSDQKKELDSIKGESLKEQFALMDELTELQIAPTKPGEKREDRFKKINQKLEDGKKLMARIKSRIVTILTKEQTAKLDSLLANIPKYVTAKMSSPTQPSKPVNEKEFDSWKKSWKPGDPIPAKFIQEEKARRRVFPTAG